MSKTFLSLVENVGKSADLISDDIINALTYLQFYIQVVIPVCFFDCLETSGQSEIKRKTIL